MAPSRFRRPESTRPWRLTPRRPTPREADAPGENDLQHGQRGIRCDKSGGAPARSWPSQSRGLAPLSPGPLTPGVEVTTWMIVNAESTLLCSCVCKRDTGTHSMKPATGWARGRLVPRAPAGGAELASCHPSLQQALLRVAATGCLRSERSRTRSTVCSLVCH